MTLIIGMNGAKRSGKDFGATILIEELERRNYSVLRTSFAKALRSMAVAVSGCEPKDIDQRKDIVTVYRISLTGLGMWLRQMGLLPGNDTDKFMLGWEAAIKAQLKLQRNHSGVVFYPDMDGWEMAGSGRDLLIVLGQAARQLDPQFWVKLLLADVAQSGQNIAVVTDVRPQNEAVACDFVVEVTSPGIEFEGTATESRLPEQLRHVSIENRLDATYGQAIRKLIPVIIKKLEAQ
uniref:Deoxynucleoside monophosphate kinase n=1 Tax=Pseudomonas phage Ulitu01 TaxID=3138550 RepID=A0AAU6W0K0_9CAUD